MITLSEVEQLKQDVVDSCQILYKEHLWEWFGEGHPSARIPGTDKVIIPGHIHPYGRGMGGVKSIDDLIVIDTQMKKISGKYDSMNEAMVHVSAYKARPDIGGVVYSHPPHCDIFAELDRPIPWYGKEIPIWDSKGGIADEKRGKAFAKALGKKEAILLRNPFSLVTTAPTLREAVLTVYMAENIARRQYKGLVIGKIPPAPDHEPLLKEWFTTYVEEYDTKFRHLDMWRFLHEKNIGPNP